MSPTNPTSEIFIKAAFNRVKARLGSKVISTISKTATYLKDTPDLIKKEWDLIKKEIIIEAANLNNIENVGSESTEDIYSSDKASNYTLNKIDIIRDKINNLTKKTEELN